MLWFVEHEHSPNIIKGDKQMRKKRYIFFILLTCLLGIILYILLLHTKKEKQICDLVHIDTINNVTLISGSNGKVTEITEPQIIQSIKDYITTMKLKQVDHEQSTGFSYMITLYSSKDLKDKIIFINPTLISINNNYYEITYSNGFEIENLILN